MQPLKALSPIEIRRGKSMRTTSVKAMHPLKELLPIVHNDAIPDAWMALSAVQSLKALSSIDTRLGRLETSRYVSDLHPLKAHAPIVLRDLFFERSAPPSFVQPANASMPIDSKDGVCSNGKERSEVHAENAPFPISPRAGRSESSTSANTLQKSQHRKSERRGVVQRWTHGAGRSSKPPKCVRVDVTHTRQVFEYHALEG